eukprot:403355010
MESQAKAPILSAYNFTRWTFRLMMNVFFRDIGIIGEYNIPQDGPIIFCGNHNNQFVDACIILSFCGRDISFLTAAKTMRRKVYGDIGRALKCIPVERPQDLATNGKGTLTPVGKRFIEGKGTFFKKELQVGDIIRFVPNSSDQPKIEDQIVESIENDNELTLKEPGLHEIYIDSEYKFKILPKVDQSQVFKHVINHLGQNGAIGIFPEGGSHDQTDILPFKAGIAFMALGTSVQYGKPVTVIPCGLKYFNHNEFRSKVILEFGRPYQATQEMVDMYKSGDKRKAVALFLKDIEERMREIIFTAPSYNELQAIYMARKLYLPKKNPKFTKEQENGMYMRFFKGYNHFKDHQELKDLMQMITQYRHELKIFNIQDYQVKNMQLSIIQLFMNFIYSMIRFIMSLIFAFPGLIMLAPIATGISIYAEKERKKALAGSDVKVKATDVMASVKVLLTLIFYPFYCFGFTITFYWMCINYFEMRKTTSFELSILFFILFPIYAVLCVRSSDGIMRHYKAMTSRILAFFYTDKIHDLQIMRKELKKKVKGIVNDFGPQLFKNFDQLRLIVKEGTNQESRGNSNPNSRSASKSNTPFQSRSRVQSKGDLLGGELNLGYKDQLELQRAFECLKELENI